MNGASSSVESPSKKRRTSEAGGVVLSVGFVTLLPSALALPPTLFIRYSAKAKKVKVVKGDFVPMASVGASQNKILADISNLPQQPKQHISVDHLLKVFTNKFSRFLFDHICLLHADVLNQGYCTSESLIPLMSNWRENMQFSYGRHDVESYEPLQSTDESLQVESNHDSHGHEEFEFSERSFSWKILLSALPRVRLEISILGQGYGQKVDLGGASSALSEFDSRLAHLHRSSSSSELEEKPKPEEKKPLDKVLQKPLLVKILPKLLDCVIKSLDICNAVTLGLDAIKNPWRSSCSHRV
ncbi:hypothetical protein JHK86_004398 [Glycine max]|nr:hypothetical protein JHK86_004398 [Glycine max]